MTSVERQVRAVEPELSSPDGALESVHRSTEAGTPSVVRGRSLRSQLSDEHPAGPDH